MRLRLLVAFPLATLLGCIGPTMRPQPLPLEARASAQSLVLAQTYTVGIGGAEYSLPYGTYPPEGRDSRGVYYRAPIPIRRVGVFLPWGDALFEGGIYLPDSSAERQLLGAFFYTYDERGRMRSDPIPGNFIWWEGKTTGWRLEVVAGAGLVDGQCNQGLRCGIAMAPGYAGSDDVSTATSLSRHRHLGFSVEPPIGPTWHLRLSEQSATQALYRQELPAETHTFVASVVLEHLDPGLSFEQAALPHGAFSDPDRFEQLELAHEPDTSRDVQCLRYSARLLVKRAPNSPDRPLQLLLRSLVCAHPTIPGVAVEATFSERGLPEELDPSLWSGFEPFLDSVRFEPAASGAN